MKQYIQKYREWVKPTSEVYSRLPQLILEVMEFADKFSETLTKEQKLAVVNFVKSQQAVFKPIINKVEEDSRLSQIKYIKSCLTENFDYEEIEENVLHGGFNGNGPVVVITANQVICNTKIFSLHEYHELSYYLEENFDTREQIVC